ncbi:fimbrial protein [Pseudomonas fluorescens]|uniref:fimbrial protein n=1 Tax=Pseudomonas fluorescens TaxID=294 RepID=UPI001BEAC563|nr:fimbrial protein [Pseudomonas fluorescens]MBT2372353.1 type 1 fimbrial protein [Pseudomonas fluorescens]
MHNFIAPRLFCCAVLLLGGSIANAADTLTVNITGTIRVPAKCTFDLASTNVDMGIVDSAVFRGVGTGTDWKALYIKSTGCSGIGGPGEPIQMRWTYNGSVDPDLPGTFKVTGGAVGVGVRLAWEDSAGDNIPIIQGNELQWGRRNSGEFYKHRVQYVQTKDTIVGGGANAQFVITIDYI